MNGPLMIQMRWERSNQQWRKRDRKLRGLQRRGRQLWRPGIFEKWTSFQTYIQIDMVNCVSGGKKNYSMWSLTLDAAIEIPPEHSGCFAFEFVGPILEIKRDRHSQVLVMAAMCDFFTFLTTRPVPDKKPLPEKSDSCGCLIMDSVISTSTHVHVSPKSGQWSTEQVKRTLCSAYFWDPCIRYIIPGWRRIRSFASDLRYDSNYFKFPEEVFRSKGFPAGRYHTSRFDTHNQPNPFLRCTHMDVQKNLQQVNSCSSIQEVANILSSRNSGWNLTNLQGDLGTIEFRRPPSSLSWFDAMCWIELVTSFTFAACENGTLENLMTIKTPGMAEFQAWLKKYRFDSSLNIGQMLDSKFGRSIENYDDAFIYLTPEEEKELEESRRIYLAELESKQISPPVLTSQVPIPTNDEARSAAAQELVDSRNKEIVFRENAKLQEFQTVIQQIRQNILSQSGGLL